MLGVLDDFTQKTWAEIFEFSNERPIIYGRNGGIRE